MRPLLLPAALALALAVVPAAWGQETRRDPHVGFLYPAGGRQGTVVRVLVGGQNLAGISAAHVSGTGVEVSIHRYVGRLRPLNGDERQELKRRLEACRRKMEGLPPRKEEPPAEDSKLAKHPLIAALETLDREELEFVEYEFLRRDPKKQINVQIGEAAQIDVTIAAGAAPGLREMRLRTPLGLSNPIRFQVGSLPEFRETRPYDPGATPPPLVETPVVLNGQIRPGDVDRFSFRAEEGQELVVDVAARRLIPFLADAVPGWFQATVSLLDEGGEEVAFADDFRDDPDPILRYRVGRTGVYQIEIRDALHRGREDFVYRVAVGELPFVRTVFPLGAQEGTESSVALGGWNLEASRLALDTGPGVAIREGGDFLRPVRYEVDDAPATLEVEPEGGESAQRVQLPVTIDGRIGTAGDADVFEFEGRAGDEIVAEVVARRLGSPIDSLLAVADASGRTLGVNDDRMEKTGHLHTVPGLLTHHADSYLRVRLPADGVYRVRVADAQRHGGDEYAYRLHLGPPRPDFELCVTPASLNFQGPTAVVEVHVLRKDGFDGAIAVGLAGAPAGFALHGARIPPGRDRIRMTLAAPREPLPAPVSLRLVGLASVGGRSASRTAIVAEDMMQAFLYRHLVPSGELVAAFATRRAVVSSPELATSPVRIPLGGEARVRFRIPGRVPLDSIGIELREPPEGVTLVDPSLSAGEIAFTVRAAAGGKLAGGYADNLIAEAFTEREIRGQKRRIPLGFLPAIPFEIVER